MRNINKFLVLPLVALLLLVTSCIKNNIDYPIYELKILDVKGEGFTMDAPDEVNRVVTLQLAEQTDISNVKIDTVRCTPEAVTSKTLIGTFNMTNPVDVTLSYYQSYDWKIVANQPIERYFKVENQLGDEVIDVKNRKVTVNVLSSADLNNIKVVDMKLGPADVSTQSPEKEELTSFQSYRSVYVSYHGKSEQWKIYLVPTDVSVAITKCDVWATKAWIEFSGESDKQMGFKYKKSDASEWIELDSSSYNLENGSAKFTLEALEPSTSYDFMAYCGDDVTPIITKTSEPIIALENGGFEQWHQSGTPWFPNGADATPYWGTGNEGSAIASTNLTTPVTDHRDGSSGTKCAELRSKNVLIKFAAGNLFVGKYLKTLGTTGGVVGFGTPFTSRPTALKGWLKFNQGVINKIDKVPAGVTVEQGVTKDPGMIYVALGTWTKEEYGYVDPTTGIQYGSDITPLCVNTTDLGSFFNPKGKDVIAYGEKELTEGQSSWVEFTIPLDYNSTSLIPTHLIIVASASKYGDYFTGSTDNVLWLDDFELVY